MVVGRRQKGRSKTAVDSPSANPAFPEVIVLKPKLWAPSLRPEYLPRPRLLKLLKAGSDRKITLIDAPPGYGKTTLLAQWRQSEGGDLPFAWVTLDEPDNDPVRLWGHVMEALIICAIGGVVGWLIILVLHLLRITF
jgi:hypothetical protein